MIQILGLFGMYFDVVVVEVKTSLLGSGHTVFDLGDLRRGSGKFFKNYITTHLEVLLPSNFWSERGDFN